MSLVRKTILLTGSSRGLGKELARYFWDKGANLVLVSKDIDLLHKALNDLTVRYKQKVDYLACDLSDKKSLSLLIDKLKNFKFDAIINNAAIQGPIGKLNDNDWLDWERTIQVNLLAPIYIIRGLLPSMLAQELPGGVSLINLSGGGATAPRPNFTAYASSKSGLVGFTATLAEELKNTNIRVNCIAPGPMPTDMLREVLDVGLEQAGAKEVSSAEKVISNNVTSFYRVAELCEFLISEKSKNVSGKLISAVWDNWEDFDKLPVEILNSDLYTLRRITPEDRVDFLNKPIDTSASSNNKNIH